MKIIDSGDGTFWYISDGLDEFEFGSATISSDFPWPDYTPKSCSNANRPTIIKTCNKCKF